LLFVPETGEVAMFGKIAWRPQQPRVAFRMAKPRSIAIATDANSVRAIESSATLRPRANKKADARESTKDPPASAYFLTNFPEVLGCLSINLPNKCW
jgi:hypothetical protein